MRSQKSSSRTILLVSYDRRLKRQLQACLAAIGLPMTLLSSIHKNAQLLLSSVAKTPPHLIFLDDSVPTEEGPVLLAKLHHSAPQALIVYIANHHTIELERTVRQHGVLYYTEKPPEDMLLQRVLAAALQRATQTGKFAA